MWVLLKMSRIRYFFAMPMHYVVGHQRTGALYNHFRCFCHMLQSPELPHWIKFPRGEQSCIPDSDDDFVLPESLEDQPVSREARCRGAHVGAASHEVSDGDIDQICGILKMKFVSPAAVFSAIGCCSVKVSQGLVDMILKRFSNDWVPAFSFFKWAGAQTSYIHTPQSYDTMVDVLGKSKQFDSMWGLVEEMVQLGGLVSLETMTKIMRRLAGAGRWGEAIKVFHDIDCFGIRKDTIAMNVLLDTLCKERSVKHARDAFLELRREIPPNASSFNALIHGWCQAQKLEEGRRTLEEMREFGFSPCVISYTCLVEAYCNEKDFRTVDAILLEMHDRGCPPNVVTYTIVMHALGKARQTEEALKVLDKMKRDGCSPDASFYNSLIYILGRAGRLWEANNIYEEMCKNGISPNTTTYNTLISALCDHSQDEGALRLLLRMQDRSCEPDVKTYTPLLKLCCRRKWMKILFYLLAHMFKRDVSLDLGTYSLLVHGLCRNGKIEQSCLFFEEMVLKGFIPKKPTYIVITEALERKNMDRAKEKVQQLMSHAQSTKQHANSMNKNDIERRPMNS